MEYRPLGRTGVQVSPLCLGCMMFGRKADAETSYAMVDLALDRGINFVDTANVYGRGVSETMLGEALQRNGKRDRVVLATKVHGLMADDDPTMRGNSRRHIVQQCEASLKRLQTDWIDLYQIHRPSSAVPIDETLRALDDLIRAGKVRYIGTSTFAAWQLVESLWAAKELGLNRFVCEQPPYNLLDRRIERELVPMAQTYGFALIPWSPLAGGFLTGKYSRGAMPEGDARMKDRKPEEFAKQFGERAYALVDVLLERARAKGCTPSQLALAWCLRQPGVTSPIMGPRSVEQLEDNLGALAVEITDEDRAAFDAAVPPGTHVTPYYGADFGAAQYRW